MAFGLLNHILISGLVSIDKSNYKVIQDTIKWADSKVADCKEPYQKKVACIRLLSDGHLVRQLLAKVDNSVVMIMNEQITNNIDSLDLPDTCIEELKNQEYVVVKVYE